MIDAMLDVMLLLVGLLCLAESLRKIVRADEEVAAAIAQVDEWFPNSRTTPLEVWLARWFNLISSAILAGMGAATIWMVLVP